MIKSRLVERWLPIAEIGIESTRERTPMTPFPAPNRLHVWWARRPLVASRAVILASLLPADADRSKFLNLVGIHGDPVAVRRRIDQAKRTNENLGTNPYGYRRAFTYVPDEKSREWMKRLVGGSLTETIVLDPTAGGGAIPFETGRLGLASSCP
jgi:putative DNA methylase